MFGIFLALWVGVSVISDTLPIAIVQNGKVTATEVGTTRILVRDTFSQLTDTVNVQVISSLASVTECTTPRPEWIWCDDFEENRLSRYAQISYGHGRTGSFLFNRMLENGRNGSFGMKATFDPNLPSEAGYLELNFGRIPKGPPNMGYAKPVDAGTADYRQIYWRFFVRTDVDWEGGNGEKLTRATVYANTNRAQAMIAHAWAHNARPNIFLLDPTRGTDAAGNLVTTKWNDLPNLVFGSPAHAKTSLMPTHGEWVCVEFMVKLNDAGQSNGQFFYWKNEALEAQVTTYNYLGAYNAYGINAVRLENWWSTDPGVVKPPKIQSRYFDNFVVSTKRIGCSVAPP